MLTAYGLRKILFYNPETGDFTWVARQSRKMRIGDVAGCITAQGYWAICINRKQFRASRLAWLYAYGAWPKNEIDHINMNRADNRLINLRAATQSQNSANRRKRKCIGYKGVTFDKDRNKWRASICKNGKRINLGRYSSPEIARGVYVTAAQNLFGEFARYD